MATILIVDDDDAMREGLAETVTDLGYSARLAASGKDALALVAAGGVDAVLLDLRMPGGLDGIEVLRRIRAGDNAPPVAVLTAFAGADNTIEAMRLGAFDHLTKPIGRDNLKSLLRGMLAQRGRPASPGQVESGGGLIGGSEAIRRVQKTIGLAADAETTVLILGETGTGKELVARAIHERSARSSNAFVKLNCAAIPTGLLESELFGHERGAFTGAIMQRIGRFELANHGTAFLDEIGEIPLELQPKLLRVLQEREFERLGSTRTLKTDARLIAATNRDLEECVKESAFRADLYYRLNVFPIYVPPLRERSEDIPLLVRHFVQHYARRMNRAIDTIPSGTMEALVHHQWPGNIRELQNLIERSVILSKGPVLQVPLSVLNSRNGTSPDGARRRTLKEAEREHILATLKETKWLVAGPRGAAARLGMNRATLQYRMKKLGILRPGM
jgi:DNA-binding NtrC family response regulator